VCLWLRLCVCLWVCYHDNSKLRASIVTKLGILGKGSDRLQLIKFWPSCAPGKGFCGGAKIFGSALQPAYSVCVSLGVFSFLLIYYDTVAGLGPWLLEVAICRVRCGQILYSGISVLQTKALYGAAGAGLGIWVDDGA